MVGKDHHRCAQTHPRRNRSDIAEDGQGFVVGFCADPVPDIGDVEDVLADLHRVETQPFSPCGDLDHIPNIFHAPVVWDTNSEFHCFLRIGICLQLGPGHHGIRAISRILFPYSTSFKQKITSCETRQQSGGAMPRGIWSDFTGRKPPRKSLKMWRGS